ncbi:MAG: hypothetical protein ABIF09_12140 [Gemmatimonadota bacterium]
MEENTWSSGAEHQAERPKRVLVETHDLVSTGRKEDGEPSGPPDTAPATYEKSPLLFALLWFGLPFVLIVILGIIFR